MIARASGSGAANRYDVVVAGARVAGASTAMLLARQGLRVLVVDPVARGRDTLSTHALMRGGVMQLHRWGLLDRLRAGGTPEIRQTIFDYGDEQLTLPVKPKDGVSALFAPRRTVLDPLLVDAACESGVAFDFGWALSDLVRDAQGRVVGARISRAGLSRTVACDCVVGADGARSRVARLVDAPIVHRASHRTASVYLHVPGLPNLGYQWTFRPGVGIGVIPTDHGQACVFASVAPDRLARGGRRAMASLFLDAIGAIDVGLAEHVREHGDLRQLRGFAGIRGFRRRAWGPGWALVGDAGYFKDPLTAHGITDALRDAELLARGLPRGASGLNAYERTRDDIARELTDVTDQVASLAWDMDTVKALHTRLARAMKAGVEAIQRLPDSGLVEDADRGFDLGHSGPSRPSDADQRGRRKARPTAVAHQP